MLPAHCCNLMLQTYASSSSCAHALSGSPDSLLPSPTDRNAASCSVSLLLASPCHCLQPHCTSVPRCSDVASPGCIRQTPDGASDRFALQHEATKALVQLPVGEVLKMDTEGPLQKDWVVVSGTWVEESHVCHAKGVADHPWAIALASQLQAEGQKWRKAKKLVVCVCVKTICGLAAVCRLQEVRPKVQPEATAVGCDMQQY